MTSARTIELVCPAGSLPALKTAVDHGADCVYLGFKDATNARNFSGLNFDDKALAEGIRYAHARGRKVLLALNTYPQADNWPRWTAAVDRAADFGIDAVILADPGLMAYARKTHPQLRLHLSVQGSATSYDAINFYFEHFGIARAVLPRVLSLAQVEQVIANTPVEIEVFGFGGLCVMVEGRCALSAFATGESPNCNGACSPGKFVRWEQTPKGMETRLNRSPAYVAQVTKVWRAAIDRLQADEAPFRVEAAWMAELNKVSEGQSHTLGAYYRPWK